MGREGGSVGWSATGAVELVVRGASLATAGRRRWAEVDKCTPRGEERPKFWNVGLSQGAVDLDTVMSGAVDQFKREGWLIGCTGCEERQGRVAALGASSKEDVRDSGRRQRWFAKDPRRTTIIDDAFNLTVGGNAEKPR